MIDFFSIFNQNLAPKIVNFGTVCPCDTLRCSQFCQFSYLSVDITQFSHFLFSILTHNFGLSTFELSLIFKFETLAFLKFYCLKFEPSSELQIALGCTSVAIALDQHFLDILGIVSNRHLSYCSIKIDVPALMHFTMHFWRAKRRRFITRYFIRTSRMHLKMQLLNAPKYFADAFHCAVPMHCTFLHFYDAPIFSKPFLQHSRKYLYIQPSSADLFCNALHYICILHRTFSMHQDDTVVCFNFISADVSSF